MLLKKGLYYCFIFFILFSFIRPAFSISLNKVNSCYFSIYGYGKKIGTAKFIDHGFRGQYWEIIFWYNNAYYTGKWDDGGIGAVSGSGYSAFAIVHTLREAVDAFFDFLFINKEGLRLPNYSKLLGMMPKSKVPKITCWHILVPTIILLLLYSLVPD